MSSLNTTSADGEAGLVTSKADGDVEQCPCIPECELQCCDCSCCPEYDPCGCCCPGKCPTFRDMPWDCIVKWKLCFIGHFVIFMLGVFLYVQTFANWGYVTFGQLGFAPIFSLCMIIWFSYCLVMWAAWGIARACGSADNDCYRWFFNRDAVQNKETCQYGCLQCGTFFGCCPGIPNLICNFFCLIWFFMIMGVVFGCLGVIHDLEDGIVEDTFGRGTMQHPMTEVFNFNKWLWPGPTELFGKYGNPEDTGPEQFVFMKVENPRYPNGDYAEKPDGPMFSEPDHDYHANRTIDLYRGEGDGPRPLIFHIHGGAWIYGKQSFTTSAFGYWTERGYTVVSCEYSLAQFGFTAGMMFEELKEGWEFTKAHASNWDIDLQKVVFFGESAGGHLASVMSFMLDDSEATILGFVNMYGFTEFGFARSERIPEYVDNQVNLDKLVCEDWPTNGHTCSQEEYDKVSASHFMDNDLDKAIRVLTLNGIGDSVVNVRVNRYFHRLLEARGNVNLMLEVPNANHGFDTGYWSVGGQLSRYAQERFLAAMFDPES